MYPSEWVKYTTPSDITPGENIGERELSVGIVHIAAVVVDVAIQIHVVRTDAIVSPRRVP